MRSSLGGRCRQGPQDLRRRYMKLQHLPLTLIYMAVSGRKAAMHAPPHLYLELLDDDGLLLAHAILTLRQSDARGVTRLQADGHQAPLTCTQLNNSHTAYFLSIIRLVMSCMPCSGIPF